MSTALAKVPETTSIQPFGWESKIDLIKRTIAKGTTDDELQLFLYTAKRTGLDPLARQIYAIKRWNSKEQREVMTIQTGIDGYRVVAARTGELAGIDDAIFDSEDGEHPNKATVTVHKMVSGLKCSFTASARWEEYVQKYTKGDDKGKPSGLWVKMPYLMLGKCAESLALRKAFPNDLSGLYTNEEMSQADIPEQVTRNEVKTISGFIEALKADPEGTELWVKVSGERCLVKEEKQQEDFRTWGKGAIVEVVGLQRSTDGGTPYLEVRAAGRVEDADAPTKALKSPEDKLLINDDDLTPILKESLAMVEEAKVHGVPVVFKK